MFNKKIALVASLGVFAVTACSKDNQAQATDTTLVTGADTVNAKAVVPTTDTIVQTATVTTDTLKGSASSSTTPKIIKKKK